MLNGVALRAQIASIIDVLAQAAVAEIAKVVEDGMVVLQVEMCQRENEIKKLKTSVEVLHTELRSTREGATLRPDNRGRDDTQRSIGEGRNLVENVRAENSVSYTEAQVKGESMERRSEEVRGPPVQPSLYEGTSALWTHAPQAPAGQNNSNYLTVGQSSVSYLPEPPLHSRLDEPGSSNGDFQQGPFNRGMLGYSQYRNVYNTPRRRKRFMFKKGFHCPYCGKYFERSGHLERHKRIHIGEKPFRCEICGRRFNQKSNLNEHMNIHRRNIQPRPAPSQMDKPITEENLCRGTQCPEGPRHLKTEEEQPDDEVIILSPIQVKSEPFGENITQPTVQAPNEKIIERVDNPRGQFRESQQWMSTIQGQNHTDYLSNSAQGVTSYPGMTQLLSPPVEASCSSYPFTGISYVEQQNSMTSQTAYGSPDSLMMSDEAGLHGMAESMLNHHMQGGDKPHRKFKSKKCFICAFCGKVFDRSSCLERHLRIHTGEKPYECQICGRCFNQKSSLKGHMRTHRNEENTDMQEAQQPLTTTPDNPPKDQTEPEQTQTGSEEQSHSTMNSEAATEPALMVKQEISETDLQTFNNQNGNNSTDAQNQNQVWSGDVSERNAGSLLHEVKYRLSPVPVTSNEQQGFSSEVKDLPFIGKEEKEDTVHDEQLSIVANSVVTLAPELEDKHIIQAVTVKEFTGTNDEKHKERLCQSHE